MEHATLPSWRVARRRARARFGGLSEVGRKRATERGSLTSETSFVGPRRLDEDPVDTDLAGVRVEQPPLEIPVRRRSSSATRFTPTAGANSSSSHDHVVRADFLMGGSSFAVSTGAISGSHGGCSRQSALRSRSRNGPPSAPPLFVA